MRTGDYAQAITAADVVIATMIRPRISVQRFVERAVAGEPPEQLLCFERGDVARLPRLRNALALRWEALRRNGSREHSVQMRALCLRWWPERVSVWEAAGQHALEDRELAQAEHYFSRASALEPSSATALTGLAVLREIEKDWERALELRRRVADQERAWLSEDPASLHRVVRYAANLGRLGRWNEAGPHFRRAVRLGAHRKLPHERPVLLRVFADACYAPALLDAIVADLPEVPRELSDSVSAGVRDAKLLGGLARRFQAEAPDRYALSLWSGMCAAQAGDAEAAYALFEAASLERPDDMATCYLALSAALEAGAANSRALQLSAFERARTTLESSLGEGRARFYAALTLRPCGVELAAHDIAESAWPELLRLQPAAASTAEPVNLHSEAATPSEHLEWWTAVRAAYLAAGYSAGVAGKVSAAERWRALGATDSAR
jgi:tetratricopeptide (TPR) repeat protein